MPDFRDPRDLRQTGFPSIAAEYIEHVLRLEDRLVPNPAATFFWRAAGSESEAAGMRDGDLMVVDRSLDPWEGCFAVCCVDGRHRIRRMTRWRHDYLAMPLNEARLDPFEEVEIWGVIRALVREFPVR